VRCRHEGYPGGASAQTPISNDPPCPPPVLGMLWALERVGQVRGQNDRSPSPEEHGGAASAVPRFLRATPLLSFDRRSTFAFPEPSILGTCHNVQARWLAIREPIANPSAMPSAKARLSAVGVSFPNASRAPELSTLRRRSAAGRVRASARADPQFRLSRGSRGRGRKPAASRVSRRPRSLRRAR
jgi:hypothetical protein